VRTTRHVPVRCNLSRVNEITFSPNVQTVISNNTPPMRLSTTNRPEEQPIPPAKELSAVIPCLNLRVKQKNKKKWKVSTETPDQAPQDVLDTTRLLSPVFSAACRETLALVPVAGRLTADRDPALIDCCLFACLQNRRGNDSKRKRPVCHRLGFRVLDRISAGRKRTRVSAHLRRLRFQVASNQQASFSDDRQIRTLRATADHEFA